LRCLWIARGGHVEKAPPNKDEQKQDTDDTDDNSNDATDCFLECEPR
jgi:hypothetical protein